jgi:hypothetical protein
VSECKDRKSGQKDPESEEINGHQVLKESLWCWADKESQNTLYRVKRKEQCCLQSTIFNHLMSNLAREFGKIDKHNQQTNSRANEERFPG